MSKVSAVLHKVEGGYAHWCPGCEEMHVIPTAPPYRTQWSFDGNLDRPTFSPSVRHSWSFEAGGECCHYFIRNGQIEFCSDSTHALAGKTVPLPDVDGAS